jgi:hypothetical protein
MVNTTQKNPWLIWIWRWVCILEINFTWMEGFDSRAHSGGPTTAFIPYNFESNVFATYFVSHAISTKWEISWSFDYYKQTKKIWACYFKTISLSFLSRSLNKKKKALDDLILYKKKHCYMSLNYAPRNYNRIFFLALL